MATRAKSGKDKSSKEHQVSDNDSTDGERKGTGMLEFSEKQMETVSLLVRSAVLAAVAQVIPLARTQSLATPSSSQNALGLALQPKNVCYKMSAKKRQIIGEEIATLLRKGVLEHCVETEEQLISNVFLKAKPNGKYRMILDLSRLKEDLVYKHFKMESLQTGADLMTRGCYLGSLDLADAYYSIPVVKSDRKFHSGGRDSCTNIPASLMAWHKPPDISPKY